MEAYKTLNRRSRSKNCKFFKVLIFKKKKKLFYKINVIGNEIRILVPN